MNVMERAQAPTPKFLRCCGILVLWQQQLEELY